MLYYTPVCPPCVPVNISSHFVSNMAYVLLIVYYNSEVIHIIVTVKLLYCISLYKWVHGQSVNFRALIKVFVRPNMLSHELPPYRLFCLLWRWLSVEDVPSKDQQPCLSESLIVFRIRLKTVRKSVSCWSICSQSWQQNPIIYVTHSVE